MNSKAPAARFIGDYSRSVWQSNMLVQWSRKRDHHTNVRSAYSIKLQVGLGFLWILIVLINQWMSDVSPADSVHYLVVPLLDVVHEID